MRRLAGWISIGIFLLATWTSAQTPLAELDGGDGITMLVEGFSIYESAEPYTPANGSYLVMTFTIENAGDRARCIYARDIRLIFEDEAYPPERAIMVAFSALLEREYVGVILGTCVDDGESMPMLAAFDVPVNMAAFDIRFRESTMRVNNHAVLPTATTRPSRTPAPTRTPRVTATVDPLEAALAEIEGVTSIDAVIVVGEIVYVEATVEPGYSSVETAEAMMDIAQATFVNASLEFSTILFDGTLATSYNWHNRTDSWTETPLSVTPSR